MYDVFLADDEVWVIIGIKKMIEKMGLPLRIVGEAHNGIVALEEIELKKPDIVIADIRMPGLDGLQLLEKIHEKKLSIKMILISGYAEFEYAQKGLRLGASDYLLKPVETEQLRKTLKNVLQEKGELKEKEQEEKVLDSTMINEVIKKIQDTYTEPITLNELAEQYHVSNGYLSRMLKEKLGMSFSEYVASKRVQSAKELLKLSLIHI